jgi:nicotinate-nucleotide adenylyltransferase
MISAVLGGSFDPFHNGHLAMVQTVLARRLADRVLVVPARRSPHKPPAVAPFRARLRMAKLAVGGLARVQVLDLEARRPAPSYTVDTLEELARSGGSGQRLRLMLGADGLAEFERWRRPERILELAELIVLARGEWAGELPPPLRGKVLPVLDFDVTVSSTEVRRRLAAGRRPVSLVPPPVLEHIVSHGLYGWGTRQRKA